MENIKRYSTDFIRRISHFGLYVYSVCCETLKSCEQLLSLPAAKAQGSFGFYRLDYTLEGKPFTIIIKPKTPMDVEDLTVMYAAFELFSTDTGEYQTSIDCTELFNQLSGPNGDFHGCDISATDLYICINGEHPKNKEGSMIHFTTIGRNGVSLIVSCDTLLKTICNNTNSSSVSTTSH